MEIQLQKAFTMRTLFIVISALIGNALARQVQLSMFVVQDEGSSQNESRPLRQKRNDGVTIPPLFDPDNLLKDPIVQKLYIRSDIQYAISGMPGHRLRALSKTPPF